MVHQAAPFNPNNMKAALLSLLAPTLAWGLTMYRVGGYELPQPELAGHPDVEFVQLSWEDLAAGPEVALAGDVQPAGGLTQVPLGQAAELIYDIRGEFADAGAGFDALRIRTGTRAAFTRLEMGAPPIAVEPVAIVEGEEELTVVLPERVGPGAAQGARVVFVADVFSLAWTFSGEVYNAGVDALSQPVEPGDASAELGTNSLRVLGMAGQSAEPVVGLNFSSRVLTPNGDGVHDEVEISYALVGVPEDVPVVFKVYSLDGRQVAQRSLGAQRFGAQRVRWDGRAGKGGLLLPGLYLVEIALQAERTGRRRLRPLTLIY